MDLWLLWIYASITSNDRLPSLEALRQRYHAVGSAIQTDSGPALLEVHLWNLRASVRGMPRILNPLIISFFYGKYCSQEL